MENQNHFHYRTLIFPRGGAGTTTPLWDFVCKFTN
nr:MAG TPA: protein of unknown function (DUF4208) [Caudoviricetes sp.]